MNNSTFLLHPRHSEFLNGSHRQIFGTTRSDVIVMILFGLVCAALGIGMAAYALNEQSVQDSLAKNGVQTLATVTDGHVSSGKSTTYYLEYSYDAKVNGDLKTFTHEESVSRDLYNRSEIGGHITVRYLPDDPATVRVLDGSFNGLIFVVIGSAFLFGALWLASITFRSYRRDRRLEQEGQILTGSVVKSSVSGRGNKRQVHVSYEFNSPLGVSLRGTQNQRRRDLNREDLPSEGTRVAVVYADDKTFRIL